MSLRTGTSLILLTHLVNKLTAFYGILAIFTGYPLSALQLSMYIYSLPVLLFTVYLAGHVRAQSAWHCLAFAHLYALDSVVNAFFTVAFAVDWFVVLSADDAAARVPGAGMLHDAGRVSAPAHNGTGAEALAAPKAATAAAAAASAGVAAATGSTLAGLVFDGSNAMSVFLVCAFWLLRMYAVFVVFAHARQVLRRTVQQNAMAGFVGGNPFAKGGSTDLAENPFAEGNPAGAGYMGAAGRLMVRFGRGYWLGRGGGGDVAQSPRRLMVVTKARTSQEGQTLGERERRRRSGTGPPAMMV
jgi:inositol phosphorylceramide synthase regulatory subunit